MVMDNTDKNHEPTSTSSNQRSRRPSFSANTFNHSHNQSHTSSSHSQHNSHQLQAPPPPRPFVKRFDSQSRTNPFNSISTLGSNTLGSPSSASTAFGLGSGAFASFGTASKASKSTISNSGSSLQPITTSCPVTCPSGITSGSTTTTTVTASNSNPVVTTTHTTGGVTISNNLAVSTATKLSNSTFGPSSSHIPPVTSNLSNVQIHTYTQNPGNSISLTVNSTGAVAAAVSTATAAGNNANPTLASLSASTTVSAHTSSTSALSATLPFASVSTSVHTTTSATTVSPALATTAGAGTGSVTTPTLTSTPTSWSGGASTIAVSSTCSSTCNNVLPSLRFSSALSSRQNSVQPPATLNLTSVTPLLPLKYTWVIWYRPPSSKHSDYEKSIKPVCRMATAQDFWRVYVHLKRPSQLPPVSDYHFFREGIRPVWEDSSNCRGGKWILRLKKLVADRYWENLLLAMVGNQFAEAGQEVCGAVLSVRAAEDVFSIWTKNDGGRNIKIRETVKRCLSLPADTNIVWKSHSDSIAQRTAIEQTRIRKSHAAAAAAAATMQSITYSQTSNTPPNSSTSDTPTTFPFG